MRLLVLSLLAFGHQAYASDAASLLVTVRDELQADHEKNMLDCAAMATEYEHELMDYDKKISSKKLSTGVLEAQLVRYEADAKALQSMITKDQASLANANAEREAMTAMREDQAKGAAKLMAEQTEIIRTIRAAISALEGGSAALLQAKPQEALMKAIPAIKSIVDTLSLDTLTSKQLDAFVQASQEDDFGEYVSKGADVVSLLHNLKSKAETAYSETKTQEQTDVFQYNIFMQTTGHEIRTLEAAISDNGRNLASMKVSIGKDEAEHKVQLEMLSTHTELSHTTTINQKKAADDCQAKKDRHEKTAKQIGDAITVLSSDAFVAGGAFIQAAMEKRKKLALVQVAVQVHSRLNSDREDQERAAIFLSDMAEKLGAPVLAQVGAKVKDGPFDGAIRMLEDMHIRLGRSESVLEFCDKQKGVAEEQMAQKQTRVDRLEAQLMMLNADVEQCKQNLADAVAEQHSAQAKLTALHSLWAEGARGNAALIRDYKTLQAGFKAAHDAVFDAGLSPDVVQSLKVKMNEMGAAINHMEAEAHGDTQIRDKEEQQLSASIAQNKHLETEYKRQLASLRAEQTEATADVHEQQKQLGLQEGALAKQKDDCAGAKMTDEERQARVEKELAAIEEALAILKQQNNEREHQDDPWKA